MLLCGDAWRDRVYSAVCMLTVLHWLGCVACCSVICLILPELMSEA
jgi:hypothetical protein